MTNNTKNYIKFHNNEKCILFLINDDLYNSFKKLFKKSLKTTFNKMMNNDVFYEFFQISTHDDVYYMHAIQTIFYTLFNHLYDENDDNDDILLKNIIVECVQL